MRAPETKRSKLKYYQLLSTFAFKFNMRRYTKDTNKNVMHRFGFLMVGRFRFTG